MKVGIGENRHQNHCGFAINIVRNSPKYPALFKKVYPQKLDYMKHACDIHQDRT